MIDRAYEQTMQIYGHQDRLPRETFVDLLNTINTNMGNWWGQLDLLYLALQKDPSQFILMPSTSAENLIESNLHSNLAGFPFEDDMSLDDLLLQKAIFESIEYVSGDYWDQKPSAR